MVSFFREKYASGVTNGGEGSIVGGNAQVETLANHQVHKTTSKSGFWGMAISLDCN
jgi:hypothetical protein